MTKRKLSKKRVAHLNSLYDLLYEANQWELPDSYYCNQEVLLEAQLYLEELLGLK